MGEYFLSLQILPYYIPKTLIISYTRHVARITNKNIINSIRYIVKTYKKNAINSHITEKNFKQIKSWIIRLV